MKSNYDFSSAEKGKFYQPDMKLRLPVRFDEDVLTYLLTQADQEGIGMDRLVNAIVRQYAETTEGQKTRNQGAGYSDVEKFHRRNSMVVAEEIAEYDSEDPES